MASLLDPRIKLRHLTAFLETARQGGVARAGAELGMTQPAISKAIAELETILDLPLFDRSRRALSLTPNGEMFLKFATMGLATLRQGMDVLVEARTGASLVAFGALPSVAAGIVPEALKVFSTSSFACRTLVESGPSPYLLGLLRTAAIDFVIGRMANPEVMEGLSFEQLYSEELAFVVRPGHALASTAIEDVARLAAFQLVMPPRQAIIRPALDALLLAASAGRLEAPIETVSNSLGRSYVLMSDAIWIISASVVARDIETGQLARLALDTGTTLGPVGITTRSGPALSMAGAALLDCVRRAVASRSTG